MVSFFDQPDAIVPDEPATFLEEVMPSPPTKTMLQELWENEPFPLIEGSEPEETDEGPSPLDEVSHEEFLRRLSTDIDQYFDWFHHLVPFMDITSPFILTTEEGIVCPYLEHKDLFSFPMALVYIGFRLELNDQIPSFFKFYKLLVRRLRVEEQCGDGLQKILERVTTLVRCNGIRNIYDLIRVYSELYLGHQL